MTAKTAKTVAAARALATAAEVAEFLGGDFSEKTLANWRSAGRGPKYIKLANGRGGSIRYDWIDVQTWVDELRRAA